MTRAGKEPIIEKTKTTTAAVWRSNVSAILPKEKALTSDVAFMNVNEMD